MRSFKGESGVPSPMRARTITLLVLLVTALLLPMAPVVHAELEELGHAGDIAEVDGSAIGWWAQSNGNVLVATSQGVVTSYLVLANGTYGEVWSVNTNTTLYGAAWNPATERLALGTSSGASVVSVAYQEVIYTVYIGSDADGLTWDRDGDLWITKRTSKHAVEFTDETPSGVSTSSHNNGITDVIALGDGNILTSGRDKVIRVHDENGSFVNVVTNSTSALMKLGVSEDGSNLFSLTDNCRFDVHNASSFTRTHSLNLCSNGQGRSMHQMGDRLMIGMTNGKSFSIDLSDMSKDQTFSVPGEVVGFRNTSGDGVLLLTAFSSKSEIHLLDTDRDNDGVVDGLDHFPDDATQDTDTDGDGWGDDASGNNADAFPADGTQWSDQDGDHHGDNPSGTNADQFPENPDQQTDSDGDGYGDNKRGQDGDKFPDDNSQWADTDGDGYGDNQEPGATDPDACISSPGASNRDRLGCQDTDGDGWSDPITDDEAHPHGNADSFPTQDSQWRDTDGDGYGDNLSGHRGDACPAMAGTSTRALMYDAGENRYTWIYRYGCFDDDGDGYDDNTESTYNDCTMTDNRTEWLDHDRDCVGSNSDYNDTDPDVQTLEEHCVKHPDDRSTCAEEYNPDANLDNATAPGEKEVDTMAIVKEFATYAGIIVVGMAAALLLIVGSLRMLGAVSAKRKPDAQYTHQDATRELDAWETGDSFETRGGIDDQKGWGDEPIGDASEEVEMDDLFAMAEDLAGPAPEPDYAAGEMIDPEAGTDEVPEVGSFEDPTTEDTAEDSTEEPPEPEADPEEKTAPAEAPPLPQGGLPEGWTTEQWRWYGHQWLEKHGGD